MISSDLVIIIPFGKSFRLTYMVLRVSVSNTSQNMFFNIVQLRGYFRMSYARCSSGSLVSEEISYVSFKTELIQSSYLTDDHIEALTSYFGRTVKSKIYFNQMPQITAPHMILVTEAKPAYLYFMKDTSLKLNLGLEPH